MAELLRPISKLDLQGKPLFEALANSKLVSSGLVLCGRIGIEITGGRYGTFRIYSGPIGYSSHSTVRMGDRDRAVYGLEFAYEHPDYASKEEQPYERHDRATKLDHSWDEVDITILPSGGRIFISKSPSQFQSVEVHKLDLPSLPMRSDFDIYFGKNESDALQEFIEKVTKAQLCFTDEDAGILRGQIQGRLLRMLSL